MGESEGVVDWVGIFHMQHLVWKTRLSSTLKAKTDGLDVVRLLPCFLGLS